MLRREKRKQQQEKEVPPQGQQDDGGQRDEEEEEEEEFPAGMDCEEEYDEEDVYVMVQLPSSVDGEALLSSSAVTVKGVGTSTPQLKVGEEVYKGKTEPIVGTTMAFITPKAGSAGREPLELACFSTMQMTFSKPPAARRKKRK
ncbi:unnamed protein product [Pylaiella littoralis]